MLVNNSDKSTVVITLTPDIFRALDTYAKLTDTARVEVVRNALENFLRGEQLP